MMLICNGNKLLPNLFSPYRKTATICRLSSISRPGLDQAYVPHKVETCAHDDDYFHPETNSSKPFTMVLPPPNITGTLHLGHALTVTVQDVLMRWKRMQGIETVWVPGMDHAGIATQVVVEKQLWKNSNKTRHDIGRDQFDRLLWQWKHNKASTIEEQLRRLRASLDWSRAAFTMDPAVSQAVVSAFVRLFDEGLVYRADSLVNWSCILQSAISDIEVEHLSVNGPTKLHVPGYDRPLEFGHLYFVAYKFAKSDSAVSGGEEEIVVATTRPETLLGDVAVAVHPSDERYSRFIGRHLWHPFRQETIPVIQDQFVDPNFGTGAVKLTPAHSIEDWAAAERHGLPVLQVIDETGRVTATCGGRFARTKRFDARSAVLEALASSGLLRGRRDHQLIVPICSRSQDVIELLVRPQWFVNYRDMARKAIDDVARGRLTILPNQYEKIWFNWLENIRDWCISRQLWWGHRIPAYHCCPKEEAQKHLWVAAENFDAARQKASIKLNISEENINVVQDDDVLDTWFSSALLPFAAFGWPKQGIEFEKYYPLSLMETGHDILFFWVARMVMLGSYLTGQLPFNKILLHGIICDARGRKMSKSLGNVVAPEDVITGATIQKLSEGVQANLEAGILSTEDAKRALQGQKKMFPDGIPECGADALRFTLCSHNIKSHFISFDVQECHVNRLFCNKIWQATKFTNMWMEKVSSSQKMSPPSVEDLHVLDKWILSRLSYMVTTVNDALENYDFYIATAALKKFLYYDFCDVYLECTKRGLRGCEGPSSAPVASDVERRGAVGVYHCWTLATCLDVGLRCLAPFMPILAQHLHKNLAVFPGVQREIAFPKDTLSRDENLEQAVEYLIKLVTCIRRLKKTFKVSAKHQPEVYIHINELQSTGNRHSSLLQDCKDIIGDLTGCCKVHLTISPSPPSSSSFSATDLHTVKDSVENASVELTVPLDLIQAFEADLSILRIKRDKLHKELDKTSSIVNAQGYKEKATPETVEMYKKRIITLEEKIQRINYMESLSK